MTTPLGRYRQNYRPPFLAFLAHPDEPTLHPAYELGRAALADDVSLLVLVRTHHTVLAEVLLAGVDPPGLPAILDAAAGFPGRVVGAFEMGRRSFLETPATQEFRRTWSVEQGSRISGHRTTPWQREQVRVMSSPAGTHT